MTTLFITAHPMSEENSTSRRLSRKFIEEYKKANPNDTIKEIDLYSSDVNFLQADEIGKMFGGEDNKALTYAKEFAAADKYVIASPMWNLNIPAILKAYIDYVTYVGVTFKYTENGPVGLLENKKGLYIQSTGGFYSQAPEYNMGKSYVEGILGFLGVTDMQTVMLEGKDSVAPEVAAEAFNKVEAELVELATKF